MEETMSLINVIQYLLLLKSPKAHILKPETSSYAQLGCDNLHQPVKDF